MKKIYLLIILFLLVFNLNAQEKSRQDSLVASMKYAYIQTNLNRSDSLNLLLLDSLIREKNKLEATIVNRALNMISKIEETPTITEIGFETPEVSPGKYAIIPKQVIKSYHNRYYVAVELSKKLISLQSPQSNDVVLENIVSFNYEGCDSPLSLNKNYLDACGPCTYGSILNTENVNFFAEYLVNSNFFDDKDYYLSDNSKMYDERVFSRMNAYANLIMKSKYSTLMLKDLIYSGSYPPISSKKRKNLEIILSKVESKNNKK